jgi:hypothetical protein
MPIEKQIFDPRLEGTTTVIFSVSTSPIFSTGCSLNRLYQIPGISKHLQDLNTFVL